MKKKFNPQQWLNDVTPTNNNNTVSSPDSGEVAEGKRGNHNLSASVVPDSVVHCNDIEQIIQHIESQQIDITTAYSDWRNIGFAFADEFGETGREYFHRISRFYPDYSATDCDRQFDNCLKAKGQGISLKTFFFQDRKSVV